MHTIESAAGERYRHRRATATVTVTTPAGEPLRDAEVTVEQLGHAFTFANIGFDFIPLANGEPAGEAARALEALYLDLFNGATLPFYWARFEPERGHPDTERLRRTARWFADRGVRLKGHPLAWHTLAPGWLLGEPTEAVEAALRDRITRDVSAFRDVIHAWDAINEAVIMPVFANGENAITPLAARLGRVEMVRLAVETARAADPDTYLLVNDFDLSADYERVLEQCLDAGIRIDAIGLQSHMHQGYWGEAKTEEILGRFARFGLPLHWTETTLLSGHLMPPEIVDLNDYRVDEWPSTPEGEARQADEIVRHYRTLLAHPAVEAVTYWGITDAGAWLGAPGGIVRADGTPKPAYDALRGLLKGEWWIPPATATTDSDGRVAIDGFAGTYRVTAEPGSTTVELPVGPAERRATLA
jgi:GH35 family endo-1,4-beta-xylanase